MSADELLGGKKEEIDTRRLLFDEHCTNHLKYDVEENYKMAVQAVSEYPEDYKYLAWLASREYSLSVLPKYQEDPTMKASLVWIEQALKHNNMVIEECSDPSIREGAIWNAMLCCKLVDRYEQALKYAEMFPESAPIIRDKAKELCLQGEELVEHRQRLSYNALHAFCVTLSNIYYFAQRKEPYVIAALDTEQAVLKAVFPDGNYGRFHAHLCCAYEKRALLELPMGNYEQAMDYLKIMMHHAHCAQRVEQMQGQGVFDRLNMDFSRSRILPYILTGLDDITKSIPEQMKNRLREDSFAPLRERADFKALIE